MEKTLSHTYASDSGLGLVRSPLQVIPLCFLFNKESSFCEIWLIPAAGPEMLESSAGASKEPGDVVVKVGTQPGATERCHLLPSCC